MTIQLIDPKLIDPNPFQPATRLNFKPDDIADLASLGDPAIGLRVVPTVRPHPTKPGRYQRCDGHRRQAAWQQYRPGEPMPNNVEDLTDRQLYDYMAIENGQRQDLTAIEKAQIVKGHIDRFGTTQAAAGDLVGLRTQGAVSNLLKLLKLPPDVQPLVNPQQVPQRIARLLVRPGELAPKDVTAIAQAVAQAADDDKEDVAENGLRGLAGNIGRPIREWSDFKIDWDPGELVIDDRPRTPGPCTTCEYHISIGNGDWCTERACHKAKADRFPAYELQRVSQAAGIPIAAKGEKVYGLYIHYGNENKAKAMLAAKKRPDHLRLILAQKNYHIGQHSRLLGSDFVYLGSTEKNALAAPKLKTAAAETVAAERASETPAQKAKRIEREQREAEQRRAERSLARRARADVTWLLQQLTVDTAAQLMIEGGVLEIAAHDISRRASVSSDWPELLDFEKSLHGKEKSVLRQRIVFKLLLEQIQTYKPAETFSWSRALKEARDVVEKTLRLKLLPGWDRPPVHRTASNCWNCGTFTPGNTISGTDRAAGWSEAHNAVTCSPKCRAAFDKAQAVKVTAARSKVKARR